MNNKGLAYKVSVIVPVYNASLYIEECVRSLMEQTLDSVEYIFVDDCCSDDSVDIINKVIGDYAFRKGDVKILHNAMNLGIVKSRYFGFENSTGLYVFHCDGDDWMELNMLEVLYDKAVELSADMVFCNFYRWNTYGRFFCNNNCGTNKWAIIKALLLAQKQGSFWSFLANRELYTNEIMYPKYNMLEDMPIVTQLVYYSDAIVCVDDALYNYRSSEGSVSNTKKHDVLINQAIEMEKNENILYDFLYYKNLTDYYGNEIVFRKLFTKRWMRPAIDNCQRCTVWCNVHKDVNVSIFFNPYIDLKEKICSLLIILRLYPYIRRILLVFS